MAIRVFKFGLLDPVEGWNKFALDILFRRNMLWNNLVALEHLHRSEYRNLMCTASTELRNIQNQLNTEMQNDNFIKIRDQKEKENFILNLKKLKKDAEKIRAELKITLKSEIAVLEKNRYDKVKSLIKESDLWWCNSASIIDAFEKSRSQAMQNNKELKFRSFDGTGKFSVKNSGGIELEKIFSGKFSFCRIDTINNPRNELISSRSLKSTARHNLFLTVASKRELGGPKQRHSIIWPLIMHQNLPEKGNVKYLEVHRKRIGKRFVWSCHITLDVPVVEIPSRESVDTQNICGIDLGFRQTDKGIQIAVLADSKGHLKKYYLDVQSWDRVIELQQKVSEKNASAWKELRPFLKEIEYENELFNDKIKKMLKSGKNPPTKGMIYIYNKLKLNKDLFPRILNILQRWQEDIRFNNKELNDLRSKNSRRRKDIYRNIASNWSQIYHSIYISDLDLKDVSKNIRDDGKQSELVPLARRNRMRASLSELILAIEQSCSKTGSFLHKVNIAKISKTCAYCKYVHKIDNGETVITCLSCNSIYDRDENAAKNYLAFATKN